MKKSTLKPSFVEFIPIQLNEGVLYVSDKYRVAAHLCCCGCNEKVVTPLSSADWVLHRKGAQVSLHPSIGNWSMACQSHYWIRNNRIVWARQFAAKEIAEVRTRDAHDLASYIRASNAAKESKQSIEGGREIEKGVLLKFVRWIRNKISG